MKVDLLQMAGGQDPDPLGFFDGSAERDEQLLGQRAFEKQRGHVEAVDLDSFAVRGEPHPAAWERAPGEKELAGARRSQRLFGPFRRVIEHPERLIQEVAKLPSLRFSRGAFAEKLIGGELPVVLRLLLQGCAPFLEEAQEVMPAGPLVRQQARETFAALQLPEHPRAGM